MDIESYRRSESLGSQSVLYLRHIGIHGLGSTMLGQGFPYRLNTMDELPVLIDHMHEGRFDRFMAEFDGLTDAEMDVLVEALVDYAGFFLGHFAPSRVPIPVSGMVSQYAIARKLQGLDRRQTILEIGPGSGFLSFFLSKDPGVVRYDQVEAMESFYLLQALINRHTYGADYRDHAQLDAGKAGLGGIAYDTVQAIRPDILVSDEPTHAIEVTRRPRAEHFPWWRLETVAERRYDVVMSNANLTEFSEAALKYYAGLAKLVLKPDGIFLMQCPGGGDIPVATALKTVIGSGFAPLAVVPVQLGDVTPNVPALPEGKRMALLTAVFLPAGHPKFADAARAGQSWPVFDAEDPLTRSIFSLDAPKGTTRSADDIVAAVRNRIM